MFAVPGLILLILFDYFKPQEYVPFLAGVPLLYIFTALTVLGFVLDLRLGLSRLVASPQIVLGVLFLGWSLLTVAVMAPGTFVVMGMKLAIVFSLYLLVGHVIQTFRMLQVVVALLLAIGLFLAFIGVHQGFADWGCFRLSGHGDQVEVYDGRPCSAEDRMICEREDAEPGYNYICEHVGLLGTDSIEGRVRFRGTLKDPNELSLAVSIVMAFALAFVARRRSLSRAALPSP